MTQKKMTKKALIISIIVITIIIVIAIIVGIVLKSKKDNSEILHTRTDLIDMNNKENAKIVEGEKENISEAIKETKKVDGYEFSNTSIKTKDGTSIFKTTVKNITEETIRAHVATVILTDKNEDVCSFVEIDIPELEADASTEIEVSSTADIAIASDFSIDIED